MVQKKSSGNSRNAKSLLAKLIPSLVLNGVFMVQAITLHWSLGTLVWVYWLQGVLIVLFGLLRGKQRFVWALLLVILFFYGIFLVAITFPSDSARYYKNGVRVSAEEVTVLNNTQWDIVAANVGMLFAGYALALLLKKGDSAYSSSEVVERLVPLHVTILLAVFVPWSVIVFLLLRSIFDVIFDVGGPIAESMKIKVPLS